MMKLRPAVERTGNSKTWRMKGKAEFSNEEKTVQFLQEENQDSRQAGGELRQ